MPLYHTMGVRSLLADLGRVVNDDRASRSLIPTPQRADEATACRGVSEEFTVEFMIVS
jgi:hypothetical protein